MEDERADLMRRTKEFYDSPEPRDESIGLRLLADLGDFEKTCLEESKKWASSHRKTIQDMIGLNTTSVEVKAKKAYLILGNYFPSPKSGKRLATFYCFCPKCKETSNYAVFPNSMQKNKGDPDWNIILDEYTSIEYYERFIKMLKNSLKRIGFLK